MQPVMVDRVVEVPQIQGVIEETPGVRVCELFLKPCFEAPGFHHQRNFVILSCVHPSILMGCCLQLTWALAFSSSRFSCGDLQQVCHNPLPVFLVLHQGFRHVFEHKVVASGHGALFFSVLSFASTHTSSFKLHRDTLCPHSPQ